MDIISQEPKLLTNLYNYLDPLHKKVKCTLVQELRLCTGRTAQRGSRGIALPFLDHGTRRGWGASVTPRPLFTAGKNSVPIVQEAGWAPGPVWTGAEYLAPTGIRSRTVQPLASRCTDWATRSTKPSPYERHKNSFLALVWDNFDIYLKSIKHWWRVTVHIH